MADTPETNLEIELKLTGEPSVIKSLARSRIIEQASAGEAVVKNLQSTYFDTPDMRLRSRGIALRVRSDGQQYVQTMKTEAEANRAVASRGEWEAVIDGPAPDLRAIADADAREMLGLILPGELRPIFTNRVQREVRLVNGTDAAGRRRRIEIAVDVGETRAGRSKEPIAELELELLEGSREGLFELARALHQTRRVKIETRSKAERGYALAVDMPPHWHKAKPIAFNPETTVDEALGQVFESCFAHWIANEPAAVDGRDPEGIHQMRVGLRRLRSALAIFGPLLSATSLDWLKPEARHTISALGDARDLDVFLEELLPPVIEAFPDQRELLILERVAMRERKKAYTRARRMVTSARYTDFVLRFGGWVEGRHWTDGPDPGIFAQPLVGYADRLLERRHRKVLKLGRKFEKLPPEGRHEVRIALKKLRYAAEFFESLHRTAATKRYVKSLSRLQTSLGHLNDVAVAETLVDNLTHRARSDAERVELERSAGLVTGWHLRGVTDGEPETVASWRAFAKSKPFWHDRRAARTR